MKISASVMVGKSSEKHNHEKNIETRHDVDPIMNFNVDEIIKYEKSYKDTFNEMCSPFIKKYNQNQKLKYENDLERFINGELKNKPKKSNKKYKEISENYFDYIKSKKVFNKQQQKTEQREVVKSVIIELGNKHNKRDLLTYLGNGNIENGYYEYKNILKETVNDIINEYPKIKFVGATIHPNENGAIGLHLDYIPFAEAKNGLISTNFDYAMEKMNKPKEKTKYNKSDKTPIYFNNFRNFIDTSLKENAKKRQLDIIENVTKDREFKNHVSPSSYGNMMEDEIKNKENEKNEILSSIKKLNNQKEKALENAKYFLIDYLQKGYSEPKYKDIPLTKNISLNKHEYMEYTKSQNRLFSSIKALKSEIEEKNNKILDLQKENYLLNNQSIKDENYKLKAENNSLSNDLIYVVTTLLDIKYPSNNRITYPNDVDEALEIFHKCFVNNSYNNYDINL